DRSLWHGIEIIRTASARSGSKRLPKREASLASRCRGAPPLRRRRELHQAGRQTYRIVEMRAVTEARGLLDDGVAWEVAPEVGERARGKETLGLAPEQQDGHRER